MITFLPHEDETTEFKRQLTDSIEKGGDIYIGVEDDGTVVGVENSDKLQLAIIDRIKNNILPTTLGFYDLVEQLGSGMKRILQVYPRNIFHFSENFMEVCFSFEEGYLELQKAGKKASGKRRENSGYDPRRL